MLGRRTHGGSARLALTLFLLVGGLVVALPQAASSPARVAQAEPSYTNPRLPDNNWTTDPFILKVGSNDHAYFDGMPFFYVPHAVSDDGMQTWEWQMGSDLLASPASWVDTSSKANVSSPSVVEVSLGSYALFFTAVHNGSGGGGIPAGKKCLGVATGPSADGPFTGTAAPLHCPSGGAEEGAMEPSPVKGITFPQLVFRRTGAQPGIYTIALEPTWLTPHLTYGAPAKIFTAADATAWPEGPDLWKDGVVEDPSLALPPGGGTPFLVFSGVDPVTNARHVGAVECPGGWNIQVVNDCDDVPLEGGRLFGSAAAQTIDGQLRPGIVGPNGAEVVADGTSQWLVYNARKAGCTTDCGGMYVDKLCFADGRPRTNAPAPTSDLSRETACSEDVAEDWMTTWAAGLENGVFTFDEGVRRFQDETWRQMVHAATGGSAVRVKLSNRANPQPLTIDAASVAVASQQQGNAASVAGPTTPLTFGGATSVTIPPNREVYSDAVRLTIPSDHDVAVSVHIPTWPRRNVSLVVANPASLAPADTALRDHHLALDDAVTLVDDGAATPTSGVDVVVVSPTATPGALGTKYAGVTVPVVNLAAPTWQASGLVSPGPSTLSGTTISAPQATELSGLRRFTKSVLTSADSLNYAPAANLGSGAVRVWTTATGSTNTVVAAYDAGAATPGGAAPARRLAIGYSAGAVDKLTTEGWAILDTATQWAAPRNFNMAGATLGEETSFTGQGNLVTTTGASGFAAAASLVQFVASVEVFADSPRGTVVVIGDSLTDGMWGSLSVDGEGMWPARLNDSLNAPANPQGISVVNVALAGDTLLNRDQAQPPSPITDPLSVLGRFNRDVLAHAGVRTVFVEIGANDLYGTPGAGSPAGGRSAQQMRDGFDQLVDRADAAGVRVVAATVPPYAWRSKNSTFFAHGDPDVENAPSHTYPTCYANLDWTVADESRPSPNEQLFEAQRTDLNARMLTPQPGDPQFAAVVDFDAALRSSTLVDGVARPLASHLNGWDCIHLVFGTAASGQPIVGQQKLAAAVPTAVLIP